MLDIATWYFHLCLGCKLMSTFKGIVSRCKCIFSNRSQMGILIFQSSIWAIWFCDAAITPLTRAVLACIHHTSVLASKIDIVRMQKVSLLLSSICSLHFLGLSTVITCIRLDQSIAVGVVCGTCSQYCLSTCACTRMTSRFAVDFKYNSNNAALISWHSSFKVSCDFVVMIVSCYINERS